MKTVTWNNAPPSAANCTGLTGEALKQCECQNGACTDLLYYFHSDHLGSSSFLSDINGHGYEFLLYLPYGEVVADQKAGGGQFGTPYKFTGKELDGEIYAVVGNIGTGLYYYGARFYDPSLGIFHGVDPLASKYLGFNPYAYVYNNPIRYFDPTGMEGGDPCDDCKGGELNEVTITAPRLPKPSIKSSELYGNGTLFRTTGETTYYSENSMDQGLRVWLGGGGSAWSEVYNQRSSDQGRQQAMYGLVDNMNMVFSTMISVMLTGGLGAGGSGAFVGKALNVEVNAAKTGGRLGNAATRSQIDNIATTLKVEATQ